MTNSSIEYQIRRKKFFEAHSNPDRSFKTLTAKIKPIKISRKKLLPDLTLYPKEWTYLVSNEKRPHTITLKQFRKKKLKEGDKIYFERGQIYNFAEYNITVDNLTFGSYGSGADPVFLGSDTTPTFTSETGGYYSMPLATAPLWVINPAGECARQGETAWIAATANTTGSVITGGSATLNALNAVESLIGAKARIKEFPFRLSYEVEIVNYNGAGGLTYTGNTIVGGALGMPFKLYGLKSFATLEGDWWYDDANNELWIKTASDPTGLGWRVITENYAFNVQASNCTIENIDFTQYFSAAIEAPDAPSLTLSNINIHDNRGNGLMVYGNTTTLTASNFTIERCGLNGIHLGAISASTFSDFTIDEIGEQDNIGWPISTTWLKTGGCGFACNWDNAETEKEAQDLTIEDGLITNVGYCGILALGEGHLVQRVKADTFCTRWVDGGGFYTVHRISLGGSGSKNVTFSHCIAVNGIGGTDGISLSPPVTEGFAAAGFYLDEGAELITVDNCTAYRNNGFGVVNHISRRNTISNSNIYGNYYDQIAYYQNTSSAEFSTQDGHHLNGNTIVSTMNEFCVRVVSANGDANYNPFANGGSNNNNEYLKPYVVSINRSYATPGGANTVYTLATWITKYGGDAGSLSIVNRYLYLNPDRQDTEVVLAVNDTDAIVNVDPPAGYEEVDGTPITDFDLNPYSSKVYLITTQVVADLLKDEFTAANGTAIAGRTPTVGPIPTIVSGTHSIQSNAMTSTVDGSLFWNLATPDVSFTVRTIVSTLVANTVSTYVRYTNTSNRIAFAFVNNNVEIFEFIGGVQTNHWTTPFAYAANTTYFLSFRLSGTSLKMWVNGHLKIDVTVGLTTGNSFGMLGQTTRTTDYVLGETPL